MNPLLKNTLLFKKVWILLTLTALTLLVVIRDNFGNGPFSQLKEI